MKDSTRTLRDMMHEDLYHLRTRNNAKDRQRTEEQIRQSKEDKARAMAAKWTHLLETAETATQKHYCKAIIKEATE